MAQKFRWNLKDYLWSYQQGDYYDLVSIIITCYNSERSIAQSVLAARLQDYPCCEVIVIDDASTDRSPEILIEALGQSIYKERIGSEIIERPLHKLRVLRNESNLGCYATRNFGIKAAKGKYITFQDSDDISVSERVTIQLLALLKNKVMVTMSMILRSHLPDFSTINNFDRRSVLNACEERRIHKSLIPESDNIYEYKYCCKAILGMVTTFFNREIFYDLDLYWTLPCIADAEFCERLLYKYYGKLFAEGENVVTFLSQIQHIPGIYYKVPEILYVSEEMRQKNITSQLKQTNESGTQLDMEEVKQGLVRVWRQKLMLQHDYVYPRLQ
jgi:glycosyltransferase involved in cell wall biosynthesis